MSSWSEKLSTAKAEPRAATPSRSRPLPVAKLIHWLLNVWSKPTISARELYTYTRYVRNSEEATNIGHILVERGILASLPPRPYALPRRKPDPRMWLIIRNRDLYRKQTRQALQRRAN